MKKKRKKKRRKEREVGRRRMREGEEPKGRIREMRGGAKKERKAMNSFITFQNLLRFSFFFSVLEAFDF